MGGKSKIKMAELQAALSMAGFNEVATYIQSGNVMFSSSNTSVDELTSEIESCIRKYFNLNVEAVVFTKEEWRGIVESAPDWWGTDKTWKHNLLVMLKPFDMDAVIRFVGELIPTIEAMEPGNGVLYQSMSLKMFGRTTTGKLASSPIYKKMTVRNYNTVTKLLSLIN